LIEYVHRVLAVVASGLVYATAIAVPSDLRKAKLASIIAAIIVSAQIVIGYFTVITGLYPLIVATHLSTGVTIIAFSLITFLWIRVLKIYRE
jgi:heme A synthase